MEVAAAVLSLVVVNTAVGHALAYIMDKAKTAVALVSRGVQVVSVRMSAAGVLTVLVRGGVLVVLWRLLVLLPRLLLLPPLLGGLGHWVSVVVGIVGGVLGGWGGGCRWVFCRCC